MGLFTLSATVMTGSTVALKWAYSKVNGVDRGNKANALDEGTIQEQVEAYVREGKDILQGNTSN